MKRIRSDSTIETILLPVFSLDVKLGSIMQREEKRFRVNEDRMLRKILGPNRK
jgi:hypothetical protein